MEYWNGLSSRAQIALAAAAALALLVIGLVLYPRMAPAPPVTEIVLPDKPARVTVYVTGLVWRPGVYTLADGSRVLDLLRKAGGPKRGWDPAAINLAKRLSDEDMIAVPSKGGDLPAAPARTAAPEKGAARKSAAQKKKSPPSGGVSINGAAEAEWETLPGIGPSMAEKIVSYHKSVKRFKKIDDLKNVPGLGEKKFEKIRPYLRL